MSEQADWDKYIPQDGRSAQEFLEFIIAGGEAYASEAEFIDACYSGYHAPWFGYKIHNEPLTCEDGFSISVQASSMHYAYPRNDYGPYTKMEMGFPENYTPFDERFLSDYMEPSSRGWPSVIFPYTPVGVIRELVNRHTNAYRFTHAMTMWAFIGVLLVVLTLIVGAGGN